MTLAFDGAAYPVDPDGILNGGASRTFVYRVGDKAMLAGGAYIGGYDDDGVVFAPVKFADDTGLGLGRVETYFVHDNRDGTMDVFYQVRDSEPLPTVITNHVVTLDAETGAEVRAATEITSGVFSVNTQAMLQRAFDLPDGNIAAIMANPSLSSAQLVIAKADGTELGRSGSVLDASVFDMHGTYDLAIVGDRIFVTWVKTDAGATRETFAQFFDMNGQEVGARITVSQGVSSGFGHLGAVQAETLSNGKVVVTWVEALATGPDTDSSSTWFAIYNADGSISKGPALVNSNTAGSQDKPILIATESGFIIGFTAFEFKPSYKNEGRLYEYDNSGTQIDAITSNAFSAGATDVVRTDNNTALILSYQVKELILPGADTPLDDGGTTTPGGKTPKGTPGDDDHKGTAKADTWNGKGGNDTFVGRGGDDDIRGGAGRDTLRGDAGNDTIRGDGGNDDIRGGTGKDTLRGDGGKDTILGDGGNDRIDGGGGNDVLNGGKGNDKLFGKAGNDTVSGGGGADLIDGGKGNDVMRGNGGRDTFVFTHGDDLIKDFTAGETLRLDDALWGERDLSKARIMKFASVQGDDIVFEFKGGHSLTLEDFTDLGAVRTAIDIF